jgi:hypothetical protein
MARGKGSRSYPFILNFKRFLNVELAPHHRFSEISASKMRSFTPKLSHAGASLRLAANPLTPNQFPKIDEHYRRID